MNPGRISYDRNNSDSLGNEITTMSASIIWFHILGKTMVVCIPVLLFLHLFFLLAIVMQDQLSFFAKDLIYFKIAAVIRGFSFYGLVSVYAVKVFGFHLCQKALFMCIIPGMLLNILQEIFIGLGALVDIIFAVSTISLAMVMIRFENSSHVHQTDAHVLTERKTFLSKPVIRIALVIGFTLIILRLLLKLFLQGSILVKLMLRFIVLPCFMLVSSSIEMQILKVVPSQHLESIIPIVSASTGLLKIFERLFTNNLFVSGDYASFAISTFFAMTVEVINHATYSHRASVFEHIVRIFTFSKRRHSRSLRSISVTSQPIDPQASLAQNIKIDDTIWISNIRRSLLVEDISIELLMIFTVTLLMYFIKDLVENESVQVIPNFYTCSIQLLMQLLFEYVCNVFGIYWSCKMQGIVMNIQDIQIFSGWFWFWYLFMLFQSLVLFYFLCSF
eukprot:TRINITY_DN12253_c0_g1_i1.p1 TRINITY_DN12253_c0_g1~~TRINITY_DN12253_c0_g1_i1.p1  ORF type:complete len:446 (+),score=62.68 TRINITY_DN12253_c0_g1_i1:55-1392(+)